MIKVIVNKNNNPIKAVVKKEVNKLTLVNRLGPQGPKGEPGENGIDGLDGIQPFVHIQSTTEPSFNIVHNLGRNPTVTAVDTSGVEYKPCINYVSLNQVQLMFNPPFSGTVTLI